MRTNRLSLIFALGAALALGGCHSNSNQTAADNSQPADQIPQNNAGGNARNPHHDRGDKSRERAGAEGPSRPVPPPPPPPPAVVVLPAGTQIRVRLDQDLSSKDSRPGDTFSATVTDDVTANGATVIPREARADGTVVDAKGLGKFKGGALLAIRLDRVHTRWGSYPVATGSIDRVEKGKGKRSAVLIGGGAGLGALIGGLAGGGKGALIGGLAGGGAGTAGSAFTGNKQIVLPAETLLTFRLTQPVHITEQGADTGRNPQLQTR